MVVYPFYGRFMLGRGDCKCISEWVPFIFMIFMVNVRLPGRQTLVFVSMTGPDTSTGMTGPPQQQKPTTHQTFLPQQE